MDGIGRVRRDHRIAGTDGGEQQVGQRVLGANGDDGFLIRVERDAVVGLIAVRNGFAQLGIPRDCE